MRLPARSPLGRDGSNPLTRMGPPSRFGRPARAGVGMGSVGMVAFAMFIITTLMAHKILSKKRAAPATLRRDR